MDLREHLTPHLEVLDAAGEPILPVVRGEVADRLRRQLRVVPSTALQSAVHDAQPGVPVSFALVDGLRVAVIGVNDAARARFTLLLAERADAGRDSARRVELTRMLAWLARAFGSTSANRTRDWRELSVLHQVLQKTVAGGSVPGLLRAYAEALAVWADIDTRAYLGNYAGRYVLDVALAGASASDAPHDMPAAALAAVRERRRLDSAEARALGFVAGVDTILSPIRVADQVPWLIAYSGRFAEAEEERIALFEDMLAPALDATDEVEASRLMWLMMQHLVDAKRAPLDAATAALAELERTGLCTAALLIVRRGGVAVLQLGVPVPDAGRNDAWPSAVVQHFTLTVPEPFEASLTLWRPADQPFSQRETRLGSIGASVLGDWASGVLDRGDLGPHQAADESADRRQSHGANVSLLVILPGHTSASQAQRETWLGDIRPQLRPVDIVGALASGEISVLLPGAAAEGAEAVATRLSRLFTQRPALAMLIGAPIGIASVDRPDHPSNG